MQGTREFPPNIAKMPRLVLIAGDRLLTLRIAQNKAVFMSVSGQPFAGGGLFETIINPAGLVGASEVNR